MTGKWWSADEEAVFWGIIVKQATKVVGEHPTPTDFERLLPRMVRLMGNRANRTYTPQSLYEHWHLNAIQQNFSHKARAHAMEYIDRHKRALGASSTSTQTQKQVAPTAVPREQGNRAERARMVWDNLDYPESYVRNEPRDDTAQGQNHLVTDTPTLVQVDTSMVSEQDEPMVEDSPPQESHPQTSSSQGEITPEATASGQQRLTQSGPDLGSDSVEENDDEAPDFSLTHPAIRAPRNRRRRRQPRVPDGTIGDTPEPKRRKPSGDSGQLGVVLQQTLPLRQIAVEAPTGQPASPDIGSVQPNITDSAVDEPIPFRPVIVKSEAETVNGNHNEDPLPVGLREEDHGPADPFYQHPDAVRPISRLTRVFLDMGEEERKRRQQAPDKRGQSSSRARWLSRHPDRAVPSNAFSPAITPASVGFLSGEARIRKEAEDAPRRVPRIPGVEVSPSPIISRTRGGQRQQPITQQQLQFMQQQQQIEMQLLRQQYEYMLQQEQQEQQQYMQQQQQHYMQQLQQQYMQRQYMQPGYPQAWQQFPSFNEWQLNRLYGDNFSRRYHRDAFEAPAAHRRAGKPDGHHRMDASADPNLPRNPPDNVQLPPLQGFQLPSVQNNLSHAAYQLVGQQGPYPLAPGSLHNPCPAPMREGEEIVLPPDEQPQDMSAFQRGYNTYMRSSLDDRAIIDAFRTNLQINPLVPQNHQHAQNAAYAGQPGYGHERFPGVGGRGAFQTPVLNNAAVNQHPAAEHL